MQELEDANDLMLANERLSSYKNKKEDLISQEEFEKSFGVDFNDVVPIDEDECE